MSELDAIYWDGGPFQAHIQDNRSVPLGELSDASVLLDEFRSTCHKYHFAFTHASLGFATQYKQYANVIDPSDYDKAISTGSVFPNADQTPGRSTIATMNQGELLESLEDGGLFEDHVAQSLVVVIYHLWNENYRPRIAKAVSAHLNQVQCTLFGDIRLVRNLIIHNNSSVPEGFSGRLTFLPNIWNLESGQLRITGGMIHSLMEQLNALRLTISDPQPTATCPNCGKTL